MLRYEADTLSPAQGPAVGPELRASLIAVEGTHSSGKTTLIRDYLHNKERLQDEYIADFGRSEEHDYPTVCVTETIHGISVPIVVVGETARQLDGLYPDHHILTDGYNLDDQSSMTIRTMSGAQSAGISAIAMARMLQPDLEKPVGLVLTDRGVLSGFSYASLRLPYEDNEHVDIAKISEVPTPPFVIHIGRQATAFAGNYDRILITDHTEIGLEQDGKRVADEAFRTDIADSITATYRTRLGADKVAVLSGSRQARTAQLTHEIRQQISQQLASTK